MKARIFLPPKSAMQSGTAKTHRWVLEYEPGAKTRDPLMGWTGSEDTREQVRLQFDTKEEAIAFAAANQLPFELELPPPHIKKPKSYADNFRFDRKENWTH